MRRQVLVTATDLHAVAELAERLARAGMQVDQVLAAVGIVTGSIEADQLAAVAALDGVAAIEEQSTIRLAPPDAEVQ